jgi:hypothetical protein
MSELLNFENAVYDAQPDHLSELGSPSLGRIAVPIEAAVNGMNKGDWISVGKRAQIVACLRGAAPSNIGNGYANYRVAPTIGSPGERALQTIGLSVSSKRPALCILGKSALSDGRILEAILLASTLNTPVIFLLINQKNTPTELISISTTSLQAVASNLQVPVHETSKDQDLQGLIQKCREESLKEQRPAVIVFTL